MKNSFWNISRIIRKNPFVKNFKSKKHSVRKLLKKKNFFLDQSRTTFFRKKFIFKFQNFEF